MLLLMAVYGYRISARTAEDFMLAGRGIGIAVMFFFVLFSISSAWTFYGYPGFLYRHGPGFSYFIWGCLAGLVGMYMFLGPRIWAVSKLNRFLSPVETVAARYESKALRFVLSMIILSAIVPYMADQALGVGLGFEALTGKAEFRIVGMLYLSMLCVLIVLLGGMRLAAWVNVVLGAVYTVTFLGSLVWVAAAAFPGGIADAAASMDPAQLALPGPEGKFTPAVTSVVFLVGLLALCWPHVVISAMTAQSKRIFVWMPGLALVAGGIFFYTVPFVWGVFLAPALSGLPDAKVLRLTVPEEAGRIAAEASDAGAALSGEEIERAAQKSVTSSCDKIVQRAVGAYMPSWAGVFVVLGVIGAALSTAAVQLMTSGILVSRDIIHGCFMPGAGDKTLLLITKGAIIAIVTASLLIAWWYPVALAEYLANIATPGFAQWGPAFVGGFVWKRGNRYGALAGSCAGFAILAGCFIFGLLPGMAVIPALAVNLILYVAVSMATPSPSKEVLRKFFDEVDVFLSKTA